MSAEHVTTSNSTANVDVAKTPPESQQLLLLHGKGQPYQLHDNESLPELAFGDLLVEIHAIGLNPIDWKSAYGLRTCYPTSIVELTNFSELTDSVFLSFPVLMGESLSGKS